MGFGSETKLQTLRTTATKNNLPLFHNHHRIGILPETDQLNPAGPASTVLLPVPAGKYIEPGNIECSPIQLR